MHWNTRFYNHARSTNEMVARLGRVISLKFKVLLWLGLLCALPVQVLTLILPAHDGLTLVILPFYHMQGPIYRRKKMATGQLTCAISCGWSCNVGAAWVTMGTWLYLVGELRPTNIKYKINTSQTNLMCRLSLIWLLDRIPNYLCPFQPYTNKHCDNIHFLFLFFIESTIEHERNY